MATETTHSPYSLAHYEGLIHVTARRYERYVDAEYDDIVQILRIKIWRALEAFDPARSTMPVNRYVFQCLRNQVKDILRDFKPRGELHIEDFSNLITIGGEIAADTTRFAARYLSVSEEDAFSELDDPDMNLPPSLTVEERRVATLLVDDYKQPQIAEAMSIRPGRVRELVLSIQAKMLDHSPDLARYVQAPELAEAA